MRISLRSMESLYSNKSSNFSALHRRKAAAAARQPGFVIASSNDVRHRVMSARVLRFKQLQNQLEVAHHQIAELTKDNRLLRALQKRQDSALSKYENTNAELPKLLHSHAEEIRTYQTKYRNLQNQNKELLNKLKQKDAHILTITDQNKHLIQLNKDRHLEERERLTERVRDLETRLIEKDNDAKMLARRLQLETKNFKGQFQQEILKQRELGQKLERAHNEIQRLNSVIEIYEKRTPSTLLKNSSFLMKSPKPTSGQLARIPNGSPTKPAFPLQSLAEPVPVTTMEISPKKHLDEGDGDHRMINVSPQTLRPLGVIEDPTPAVTPAKLNKTKKKHSIATVSEEQNNKHQASNDQQPNHQLDETFCKEFNQYALQQETEFDEVIENELSRLKEDISFEGHANGILQRKKHFVTTEVSYEEDYEPELYPEENIGTKSAIYDHKLHITELEEQIRNMGGPLLNGIDSKCLNGKKSASSSDTDQDSNTSTNISRDSSSKEFESMKREIRQSILKKECLLDTICDEINGKDSHPKSHIGRPKDYQKRSLIDPKKKKNLLEALKAIDGESFDK
ncbi:lebercilin-like protein isoform X2 [Malaya genurostris]|uniref:lebercilin-like protein isoform X2 n=1 Tax=Malaya genurostris TaxID=325434 RepID=UPI0026F3A358|nr:lebercilin-like protein isoform X2 [Malaya genurostris]